MRIAWLVHKTWIESRFFIVFHISYRLMHQLIEEIVDRIKHTLTASEILMQLDFLVRALFLCIRSVFFHKQLRTRQTEAIDTLLDIADHEKIGRIIP